MTIRVLIADDHLAIRQGMRLLLELDPEFTVVGEAGNGHEAVKVARELRPDVVVMDLKMPGMDGIHATAVIRRDVPESRVLALTGVAEDRVVAEVFRAGAIGCLVKDVDVDELRRAIKGAATGRVQIAPVAATQLLREAQGQTRSRPLTERETAVLRLLTIGHANKEIARKLGIGETTVKSHVRHILDKLDVSSRTQAALQAIRCGLVPVDAPALTPAGVRRKPAMAVTNRFVTPKAPRPARNIACLTSNAFCGSHECRRLGLCSH